MPYVKKYSAQTCINFRPAKSPIYYNYKSTENKNKTSIKNKQNDENRNLALINEKLKVKNEDIKNKYKANIHTGKSNFKVRINCF